MIIQIRKDVLIGCWTALAFGVWSASAAPVRLGGGSYDGYDAKSASCAVGVLAIDNADGATNVKMTHATVSGCLWDADTTQTEVYVYWGTTDGGTNKVDWDHRLDFGECTPVQFLSTNITGLADSTDYHYRFYASNASGQETWAESSSHFTTMGAPVVTTGTGATSLGLSAATLNGVLTSLSGTAVLFVYWGEDTNTASSASTNLGVRTVGSFSTTVSGLRSGALYYYRCLATNEYGTSWSEFASFRTVPGPLRFGGGGDGYDAMTLQTNFEWGPKQTVIIIR